MRNLIWIGAILVIVGAAGIGLHEVDATQVDVLNRTVPAGVEGGSISVLASWIVLLAVGGAMMLAGRRAS